MPVAVCPSAETLAAFARGDLPVPELAGVAEHVGGCAACGGALKFVPEDSLADLARAAAASPNTVASIAPPTLGVPTLAGALPAGFADHPRYRIVSQIGAGGMGTVYKAEDLLMGRVIAIKVVSPHLTARPSAVERFRKEIRAAAQLNHPSVITAHDTGEAGGAHFLVMEFIEGVSLDRVVAKNGPLPVPTACAFARRAALGLQHAADKGMVHRDIKPQNLMVTRKGQVKILDFGLARFAHVDVEDEDASPTMKLPFGSGKAPVPAGVTNPNMLMGTPDYLSPEQAKNSHDVDHRSDIYSLGCTLYFMLTGKPPFLAATTLIDKLLGHTNDAPPPVRAARPEIPAGLADVLDKMMAKKPADRYQTAAEVASALLPFTRSDSAKEPVFEIVDAVVVTPAPASPLAFDTAPVQGGPTLADSPRPKKSKKSKKKKPNRRKWFVLGGVAALFLVVAVALATRGKKPTDAPADPTNTAKANPPTAAPARDTKDTKAATGEKGSKSDKGSPAPPVVISPPSRGVQILYVVPSNGVWWDDYEPVRARFVSKGATVTTAAFEGDQSASLLPGMRSGPPVAINKPLADVDARDYSAVIFCGERAEEYMYGGRGAFAASQVIQKMQQAGKPVGAICVGQGVLVVRDQLRGKKAAPSEHFFKKHPFLGKEKSGIMWDNKPGVVVDGKIVTASGPPDAAEFADAILKLIEGK